MTVHYKRSDTRGWTVNELRDMGAVSIAVQADCRGIPMRQTRARNRAPVFQCGHLIIPLPSRKDPIRKISEKDWDRHLDMN